MATYQEWNKALFDYTLAGLSRGARVYLSIDDEALAWIAASLNTTTEDYIAAVRLKCVYNDTIRLERIPINTTAMPDEPRYLAFLCAMVLAAHRMGEQKDHDPKDFFSYFNDIMGLFHTNGRPGGLEQGSEKQLWSHWNRWLQFAGYQPTAHEVIVGKPFSFALSQALLRSVDKNALWRHFGLNTSKYPDRLGKGELLTQLRNDSRVTTSHLPKHLEELLQNEGKPGTQRYDDLADSLYESFTAWLEAGRPGERTKGHQITTVTTLRTGLYRTEDYISGDVRYYLLPRQPRHIQVNDARVIWDGNEFQLIPSRHGWFEPLPQEIDLQAVDKGLVLPIEGISNLKRLVLDDADFWILPPDPEDINSGVYASWEDRPEVGVAFLLLCKPSLQMDMQSLRKDGLLDWDNETILNGWLEYSGVKVLKDVWSEAQVTHPELVNQLRPRAYVGVVLAGGLRDTRSGAWLTGCGPQVIVNAFAEQVKLRLLDVNTEEPVGQPLMVRSGITVSFDWTEAGGYVLQVEADEPHYNRFVQITDWQTLDMASAIPDAAIELNNASIRGAWIEEREA